MIPFHRRLACVAIACTALGCAKGDAPPADSAKKLAATPAATPAPAAQMPGTLTKPIDSYTGDELYDFVRKLQFTGGHERDRKCRNDPACTSPKSPKRIKVAVDAVALQDSIAPINTSQFGVVYIRAVNKGDAEEARYGLKPGPQLENYVIVLPDTGATLKWRLEQLDTTSKARTHMSIGTGPFISCKHDWTTGGARADFKTCLVAAARHDSVVTLGLALQAIDDPMWSACAGGCCYLGP